MNTAGNWSAKLGNRVLSTCVRYACAVAVVSVDSTEFWQMHVLTHSAGKLLMASAIALSLPARPVEADEPVTVAVITAVGVIGAAAVAGAATMGAAAILVIGEAMSDGEEGEESGENGGAAVPAPEGGGEQSGGENRRTVGEPELPEFVRAYVDREVTIGAQQLTQREEGGDGTVRTAAEYRFRGDIQKAEAGTRIFNLRDGLIFRFDVPAAVGPEDLALVFEIDELRLSTTDVAGTDGFSRVEFTATQDGAPLWRWAARVDQGQRPRTEGTIDVPDADVRRERNLLVIRGVEIPTAFMAAPEGEATSVEFMMRVEGQGERI